MILALSLAPAPARACGPVAYWPAFWLDQPQDDGRFLAGDLGIVDPAFSTTDLWVVFRYLSGRPLPAATQRSLMPVAREVYRDPSDDFLSAAREAGADPGKSYIGRETSEVVPEGEWGDYFLNCLDDAFLQATKTLKARQATYGPDSRELLEWIAGQLRVFESCSTPTAAPAPLGEPWPAALRADRAYQIAAADFYAQRYDDAAARFEAIAADRASAWSPLAALVLARAHLRAGRLAEADARLDAVLARADAADLHASAQRLKRWVALRLQPGQARRQLAERLLAADPGVDIRAVLQDYSWLSGQLDEAELEDDFQAWVSRLDPEEDQRAAYERFARQKSPLTLVGALMVAEQAPVFAPIAEGERPQGLTGAELDLLIAEAATLEPGSPGFATARFHRARLLVGLGRGEEARRELDGLLGRNGWTESDRQRLLWLRAQAATDLGDLLRHSLLKPLGEIYAWDEDKIIPFTDGDPHGSDDVLIASAVWTLNRHVPPADWLALIDGNTLPARNRTELASAGFVRAALAGQEKLAEQFAGRAAKLHPELAEPLEAWRRTATGEPRRFAAALLALRFPGLSVDLYPDWGRGTPLHELDSLRGNWWCASSQDTPETWNLPLAWREKPPGDVMRPAEVGPIALGQVVLAHARSQPDDPDLPEALHLVVRSTRYGCPGESFKEVSKGAFDLLHKKFPRGEWAAKTKYWFE